MFFGMSFYTITWVFLFTNRKYCFRKIGKDPGIKKSWKEIKDTTNVILHI